jgi:dUTP pyrophosphatase
MLTRFFEKISATQEVKDFGELDLPVKAPQRATKQSAGYDIYSTREFVLLPGEEVLIPTGYKVFMQPDEYLAVHPRSGQGFKYYVRLANTTGVIDADYYGNEKNEGHIWVKLRNESTEKQFRVEQGEAICQAIFHKYLLVDGDSTEDGEDRKGGFGSTGV